MDRVGALVKDRSCASDRDCPGIACWEIDRQYAIGRWCEITNVKGSTIPTGDKDSHMLCLVQDFETLIDGGNVALAETNFRTSQADTDDAAAAGVVGVVIDEVLQFVVDGDKTAVTTFVIDDVGSRCQTHDHLDIECGLSCRLRCCVQIDDFQLALV